MLCLVGGDKHRINATLPVLPPANRCPDRIATMHQMLGLPHIAPLAGYSAELRNMRDGWHFPEFDPLSGGVHADMLFLLEKPGPMAGESNFISMCNDDPTAEHPLAFLEEAEIDYRRLVIWNVMPGWNGDIRFTAMEREWGLA